MQAQDYDAMDVGLADALATQLGEGTSPTGDNFNIDQVFGDALRTIYAYVWRSQMYAFTVLGGYVLCVAAIFALQGNINSEGHILGPEGADFCARSQIPPVVVSISTASRSGPGDPHVP